MADPLARMMALVVPQENGCWEYTGAKRNNYGSISVDGQTVAVHRFAYQRLVGLIPVGHHIDHLCKNTMCVNPNHLDAVTQAENNARKRIANPVRGQVTEITECVNGHPWTDENTYWEPKRKVRQCRTCRRATWSKGTRQSVTDTVRDAFRHLSTAGLSQREIAERTGFSKRSVGRVLRGESRIGERERLAAARGPWEEVE